MKFMGYFKEQAFDCDGNKYDETLVDEDSFENHYRPSSNEVRGHSLMGTIGEIYIRRKLRDDGYQTARINQFYGRDKLELGKVKTEGWNKLNVEEIEELLKDYTGDKELVMQLLANNKRGLPDFLCLKEGKLFFFEVKSNKSKISADQTKTFKMLKQKGFNVFVIRVLVEEPFISEVNKKLF